MAASLGGGVPRSVDAVQGDRPWDPPPPTLLIKELMTDESAELANEVQDQLRGWSGGIGQSQRRRRKAMNSPTDMPTQITVLAQKPAGLRNPG